jgi:hypothetical protein
MLFWKRPRQPTPLRRLTESPVPPPLAAPPPEPSLMDSEAQLQLSVDQTQQLDAREQRRRLDEATDQIAQAIAWRGSWFPRD